MAIKIVPAGDERCDVCAGEPDLVKPRPGERWSARAIVGTICEACRDDFFLDVDLGKKLEDHEPQGDPNQN